MKIVYSSGTFDLFHIGHLNVLRKSKALGDYLVVGVSTDELVATYKVKAPIICYDDRAEIIRNLSCVNQVERQCSLFDPDIIARTGANVVTIGSDWRDKSEPNLDKLRDNPNVELVFLPYTLSVSSTKIKTEIQGGGWQRDK